MNSSLLGNDSVNTSSRKRLRATIEETVLSVVCAELIATQYLCNSESTRNNVGSGVFRRRRPEAI
jgi:hypothetical protein